MSQQTEAIKAIIAMGVREVALSPGNPLTVAESGPVAKAITDQVLPGLQHATNTEPWYQSRVTWGALGAIVLPLLGYAGITSDILSLNDFIVGGMTLASVISGAVTLWGRWKARKPIGMA